MGWDIDNKHIIFEKIIAVANLLSNTKVRDYKKV